MERWFDNINNVNNLLNGRRMLKKTGIWLQVYQNTFWKILHLGCQSSCIVLRLFYCKKFWHSFVMTKDVFYFFRNNHRLFGGLINKKVFSFWKIQLPSEKYVSKSVLKAYRFIKTALETVIRWPVYVAQVMSHRFPFSTPRHAAWFKSCIMTFLWRQVRDLPLLDHKHTCLQSWAM